mmetsp:Transcript_8880/g.29247  ORF Transcript_8880/g.29247 Transcript_8880/m.29247 type:complete len:354 (+) Transcript_8880:4001-5062(+)
MATRRCRHSRDENVAKKVECRRIDTDTNPQCTTRVRAFTPSRRTAAMASTPDADLGASPLASPRKLEPTDDVPELKRRLERAKSALIEQKRLMSRAADEYGTAKDLNVQRLRQSRARAQFWLKVALVALVATSAVSRRRGSRATALGKTLATCESDSKALERVNARLKLAVGSSKVSGKSASEGDVIDVTAPKTFATCMSTLAEVGGALDAATSTGAACARALAAVKKGDTAYFDDAVRLRALLDDVKQTLEFKERALKVAANKLRSLRAVVALIVIAVTALASQSNVRESFRNLLASTSDDGASRAAPDEFANARPADNVARDASPPKRAPIVPSAIASPSKFARTNSKTTF